MGCFAKVKLAKFPDGRPCALKIVDRQLAKKLKQGSHLLWERKLLGCVNNPYIVKSYGCFHDADRIYFVMEYLAGGEIYNVIRYKSSVTHGERRKQLKSQLEPILFYMAEVAVALEYLHRHEITYRDLKPENVLIDAEGHAKIADLGFAKRLDGNRTLTLCGTPGYLAPEQVMKRG